jgi:serine/threonine protein phosphatase 1
MNFAATPRRAAAPAAAAAAPGAATEAVPCAAVIGDVHGDADALRALLDLLAVHLGPDLPVYCTGDLVDRGPDPRGVVQLCIERRIAPVLGNHDAWLRALARGDGFDSFALSRTMGGESTLRSYAFEGRSPREVEAQRWRIPADHVRFLSDLPYFRRIEVDGTRFWLSHAGATTYALPRIREEARARGRALDAAEIVPWLAAAHPELLLWPELNAARDPGCVLRLDAVQVFGHSPLPSPVTDEHFASIDTGAGSGGPLSALILPGGATLQVGPGGSAWRVDHGR